MRLLYLHLAVLINATPAMANAAPAMEAPAMAASMPPPPALRVPAAVNELCKPSDIEQKSTTEYEVTSGVALQAFVDAVGPDVITHCNLHVAKPYALHSGYVQLVNVQSHSAARRTSATVHHTHRLSDLFTLTAAGTAELHRRARRCLADPLVVRSTMYCSGKVAAGSERQLVVKSSSGPNCQRKCGGAGHCVSGCKGVGLGHACQFHITISASLTQVAKGKVTVKVGGSHVPHGTPWVPVHHRALAPSKVNHGQAGQRRCQVWSDSHLNGEQERR